MTETPVKKAAKPKKAPLFTPRHHNALAKAWHDAGRMEEDDYIIDITEMLEKDNPKFNRIEFMETIRK